ncbi:hypothetical protein [Alteromonas facilis]|uniref:hypothetical protein n=1 Tax=Alteromonas facilis TaxID=2048004 RepID=UPI000C293DD2|nr:hypothetical protein [Alteromonas facilis]
MNIKEAVQLISYQIFTNNEDIISEIERLKSCQYDFLSSLPKTLIEKMRTVDALLLAIGHAPAYQDVIDMALRCRKTFDSQNKI